MKILNCEKPITEKDILELEKRYTLSIPHNLRNLLLKNNGGVLDEDLEDYSFNAFFSIKHGEVTMDFVIDSLQITEQHILREEIPFGDDSFGNIFTISTREEDYGKIYYWEMDVGEPRRSLAGNSLEEFFGDECF